MSVQTWPWAASHQNSGWLWPLNSTSKPHQKGENYHNISSGGDDVPRAITSFNAGVTIFAYHVKDLQRYGVAQFASQGKVLSLEEKPAKPKSNFVVSGAYICDNSVVDILRPIKPSARGEPEIANVNLEYLWHNQLSVHRLSSGFDWLDVEASTALQEASANVETIERRQGVKVGCAEEAALVRGFVALERFQTVLQVMPNCEYQDYLMLAAQEAEQRLLS